jgi:hypothetical protein
MSCPDEDPVAGFDEPDWSVRRRLNDRDRVVAIEAHLEMRQEDLAGPGGADEASDRGRVEVLGAGRDRSDAEGDLDEERVAPPDQWGESPCPSAVAGVDEPGRTRRGALNSYTR